MYALGFLACLSILVLGLLYKMSSYRTIWSIVLAGTATIEAVSVSRNGLGATPQMGWNNWNSAGCDGLSQELILNNAQKLVDVG